MLIVCAAAALAFSVPNRAAPPASATMMANAAAVYDGAYAAELVETATKMVAAGKGLLACDESTGTVGKRLESIGLKNTEENRQTWRNLLFTTPDLQKYISVRAPSSLVHCAAAPKPVSPRPATHQHATHTHCTGRHPLRGDSLPEGPEGQAFRRCAQWQRHHPGH